MTHTNRGEIKAMGKNRRFAAQGGFSLLEMLTSICILIPIMAGAISLFSVGVNQHASEQSSVAMNQEASSGFNMMIMEIAQAGSHGDTTTTITAPITANSAVQTVSVASSNGFCAGDVIEVLNTSDGTIDAVEITAVGTNTISGVFRANHEVSSTQIRLFSLPYMQGVLTTGTLNPNTATTVTMLRFFGDIYGDGNMYYVEYNYDSANAQITRSMTRFDQTQKQPAVPLIRNISPGAAQFILHTNAVGVVTAVTASLTVESQWETASQQHEEVALSSRVAIPSAEAASALYFENLIFGGINNLPPIPSRLSAWTSYGDTYYEMQ